MDLNPPWRKKSFETKFFIWVQKLAKRLHRGWPDPLHLASHKYQATLILWQLCTSYKKCPNTHSLLIHGTIALQTGSTLLYHRYVHWKGFTCASHWIWRNTLTYLISFWAMDEGKRNLLSQSKTYQHARCVELDIYILTYFLYKPEAPTVIVYFNLITIITAKKKLNNINVV